MSEPKGRGGDWTEERGTSDEGRSRLEAARRRASGEELTSVEDHLAEILRTIVPLAPTELSLGDVLGLVLAQDVAAASPLPSFDNSAMDGYAVHVQDIAAATEDNPVTLPVVAEVAAGDTGAYALSPGTSIKIMTGAMLPHGTEAVVPVEWTDGGTARVAIRAQADYGNAIRLPGRRRQGRRGPGHRGHPAPSHARRGDRGGRARVRPGPAQAAGGGAVHRERADRAGRADRPRPDLGLQQLHDRRGGPGRPAAWPTGRPSSAITRTRCCRPSRTSWSGPT